MLPAKQLKKKIESRREWRQISVEEKGWRRGEKKVRKVSPNQAMKDKPLQSVWKKVIAWQKKSSNRGKDNFVIQRQNQLEQVNNKFLRKEKKTI